MSSDSPGSQSASSDGPPASTASFADPSASFDGLFASSSPTATPFERPKSRSRFRQTAAYVGYMLAIWPAHLAIFIVVITLVSLGVGLSVFVFGLPVALMGLMLARSAAKTHRKMHASLTGRAEPEVVYLTADDGATPLQKVFVPLRDPQLWLDCLWVILMFPVSTATWAVTLAWVATIIAGLGSPVVVPLSAWLDSTFGEPGWGGISTVGEYMGLSNPLAFDIVFDLVVGVIFLVTAPFVLGGMARFQLGISEVLLSNRARGREDIERLKTSRAAARDAETSALRRLERDLHDGPQQRLVRLNMDLARAKRQAERDPAKVPEIVEQAMVQTQETLQELRQLSRGIAPPILIERGLGGAVGEAAARSIIPVTVRIEAADLPLHVALAAYYVAAEALVNVNKHSRASRAEVAGAVQDGKLFLSVTDDGVGGASAAKGYGLAGLVERLMGVDGTLNVSSPPGGPTVVEAVIPCESY
ncbi:MAG: sensor domain-containing protein [Actinomycetaceae bacterium]|nr:sensor domain-containing protein [Actinomycetaceae bacterium]